MPGLGEAQQAAGKVAKEVGDNLKDIGRITASGGTDIAAWISMGWRWGRRFLILMTAMFFIFMQALAGQQTAAAECADASGNGASIASGPNAAAVGAGEVDMAIVKLVYDGVLQRYANNPDLPRVMLAAMEAGLAESNMRNLRVGHLDSLGVFQQRAGWGTAAERTNPTWALNAFLNALEKQRPNHPTYAAHELAQATQISMCQGPGLAKNFLACNRGQYGGNYQLKESKARELIQQMGGLPAATPGAPVSANGVPGAENVTPTGNNVACANTNLGPGQNIAGKANVKQTSKGIEYTIDVIPDGPRGAAISAAFTQLGVNYVWGGTNWRSGASGGGLDCSGLTSGALKRAVTPQTPSGISIPRTSREQFKAASNTHPTDEKGAGLTPGDLVFWSYSGPENIHHVAIYLGTGKVGNDPKPVPLIVAAPQRGDVVKIQPLYKNGNMWGGDPGYPAAVPTGPTGAPAGNLPVKA